MLAQGPSSEEDKTLQVMDSFYQRGFHFYERKKYPQAITAFSAGLGLLEETYPKKSVEMSYGHFYLFLSYWENEDIVNAIAHLGNITTTEAGLARAAFHRHDILALLSKGLYEESKGKFQEISWDE